jgi:hypothetical protein
MNLTGEVNRTETWAIPESKPGVDFVQLKEMVDAGQLKLIHIISTPRSSSTALERALYQSPNVDGQINDVWADYDSEDREGLVYRSILEKVRAIQQRTPQKNSVQVIVKSIADYIPPGLAFERMTDLAQNTVFLVRNPLLQMESMMRVMAEAVASDSVVVGGVSMDEYARHKGYTDWLSMQSEVNQQKRYFEYEEIFAVSFPADQEIHQTVAMKLPILEILSEISVQELGFDTLDTYARVHNYLDWESLLVQVKRTPALLDDFHDVWRSVFACRITGWEALGQHVKVMERAGRPFEVVDSTTYRAQPANYLKSLAESLAIAFGEEILDWEASHKAFDPGDDEGVSYYQKVIDSSGVQPPTERPISLDHFPRFIQAHLLDRGGAFEVYVSLLNKLASQISQDKLSDLLATSVDGAELQAIDPVFAYTLLSLKNDPTRAKIANRHPEFMPVFAIIDSQTNTYY